MDEQPVSSPFCFSESLRHPCTAREYIDMRDEVLWILGKCSWKTNGTALRTFWTLIDLWMLDQMEIGGQITTTAACTSAHTHETRKTPTVPSIQ